MSRLPSSTKFCLTVPQRRIIEQAGLTQTKLRDPEAKKEAFLKALENMGIKVKRSEADK